MNVHPLLRLTRRQPAGKLPTMPMGSAYDAVEGLWRLDTRLLAREPCMASTTKKKDVEVGEDVKGQ